MRSFRIKDSLPAKDTLQMLEADKLPKKKDQWAGLQKKLSDQASCESE